MQNPEILSFRNVNLHDGFWARRYTLNKNISLESVRQQFERTARFDALRFNYLKNGRHIHYYYDSDAAKWIEAVSYLIEKDRPSMAENEAFIDELVDCMKRAQRDDGYLNSYFQQIAPDEIFRDRECHELYCAGHLIEAAVAYAKATGKRKFLHIMEKYCDYICRVFIEEKSAAFVTPGHEEIELALIKLYRFTHRKKYLEMAEFFLKNRGVWAKELMNEENTFCKQDDCDIFNLHKAVGHCVRALYLYCGIADLALEREDITLRQNLQKVFEDIVGHKMYITGGVGSSHRGECFTAEYDLPNHTAYSESCASIAMILFALRMRKLERNAKYGHVIERIMYNSLLSSCSLDGKSFFYVNPLEIALEEYGRESCIPKDSAEWLPIKQRKEVFDCSCCPPNLNRFFAEIGSVIAVCEEDALFVEQYVSSDLTTAFGSVSIREQYALDGCVDIFSENYGKDRLAVRIPEWSRSLDCVLNGEKVLPECKEGYAYFTVEKNFSLSLNFHIAPVFVSANPNVRANVGRVALTYGPVVYCLEGVENGTRLNRISVSPSAAKEAKMILAFHGLYSVEMEGFIEKEQDLLYFPAWASEKEEKKLTFIPYFAFANRGESDMLVWVRRA